LGFLTGVCLTVAVFVLVVVRWQNRGHESTQVMMEPAPFDGTQADNLSNAEEDCRAASRLAMTGETPQAGGAASGTHPSAIIARSEATHPSAVIARNEATKQSPTGYSAAETPCIETASAITDDQAVTDAPARETTQITDGQPDTAQVHITDSGITEAAALAPVATNAPPASADQPSPARQSAATGLAATSTRPEHASIDERVDGETTHTHIFWSPFRSQWAAEGFARRLTNATQIPIEIVEAGSGQYRVAFDYRDEGQRLEHIERIESITGLQLE
jgi:hypothetical protein